MKVGDLVKFWDYEGGDGYVPGLVVNIADYQYSKSVGPIPSLYVVYNNKIQIIPTEGEMPTRVVNESR